MVAAIAAQQAETTAPLGRAFDVAVVQGKQPYDEFVRTYEEAQLQRRDGATAEVQRRAYSSALRNFLRIPEEHARWVECLPAGAFSAQQCGELSLALRLYQRAEEAGVGGDLVIAGRLELLVVDHQVGRADRGHLLPLARRPDRQAHPAAVGRAV